MKRYIFSLVVFYLLLPAQQLCADEDHFLTISLLGGQALLGSEWNESYISLQGSDYRYEEVDYLDAFVYGISVSRSKTFSFGYDIQFGMEAIRLLIDKEYTSDHYNQKYQHTFEGDYETVAVNAYFNNSYYIPVSFNRFRPFVGLALVMGMGYAHTDSQSTLWPEQLEKKDPYYGLKPSVGGDIRIGEQSFLKVALEYRHDLSEISLPMYTFSVGYKWSTD